MPYRSRIPKIAAELSPTLDAVAKAGADTVAVRAKERVPVGSGEVHLRDRIHVEREGVGEYVVVAGDDEAFYGHIVEHGSVKAPPHPFLIPAGEETRDEYNAMGRAALRKIA